MLSLAPCRFPRGRGQSQALTRSSSQRGNGHGARNSHVRHVVDTRVASVAPPVLATQDICSHKRYLKGVIAGGKSALFERMSNVASTGGANVECLQAAFRMNGTKKTLRKLSRNFLPVLRSFGCRGRSSWRDRAVLRSTGKDPETHEEIREHCIRGHCQQF
jgi:hypothetical protein